MEKKFFQASVIGDVCVGFDFDAPLGVEQSGDDHGGCGQDISEDFTVSAADLFPILCSGEEHAGAVDVLVAGSGFFEGGFDDFEGRAGLVGGRGIVRTDLRLN